jgi:hypothetical protein
VVKHDFEIVSTREGMQMNWSAEHIENADSPKFEILQAGANAQVESFVQQAKQEGETASVNAGIQMDSSDEQWRKAHSPRLESLEPASNVRIESDPQ